MSKENIGKRLKQVREYEVGISQVELSNLTGIPQTTLSKIERGKQDGSSDVALIADALGVAALWLSHGKGDKHVTPVYKTSNTSLKDNDVFLHQYADPRCNYGPNSGSATASQLPEIPFPRKVFDELSINEQEAFSWLTTDAAIGNPGDACLVNTAQKSPSDASGMTFAIRSGTGLLLRDIHVQVSGWRLSCPNPDKNAYPDESVPANNDLDIVGRVRYVGGTR